MFLMFSLGWAVMSLRLTGLRGLLSLSLFLCESVSVSLSLSISLSLGFILQSMFPLALCIFVVRLQLFWILCVCGLNQSVSVYTLPPVHFPPSTAGFLYLTITVSSSMSCSMDKNYLLLYTDWPSSQITNDSVYMN